MQNHSQEYKNSNDKAISQTNKINDSLQHISSTTANQCWSL